MTLKYLKSNHLSEFWDLVATQRIHINKRDWEESRVWARKTEEFIDNLIDHYVQKSKVEGILP